MENFYFRPSLLEEHEPINNSPVDLGTDSSGVLYRDIPAEGLVATDDFGNRMDE